MKQCPQCGFLADDKKTICPDCQASIVDGPSFPDPPREKPGWFLVFNLALALLGIPLALFFGNARLLAVVALLSFGLGCFRGMLFLCRHSQDDGGDLVTMLCVIGILLTAATVVFGGCGFLS